MPVVLVLAQMEYQVLSPTSFCPQDLLCLFTALTCTTDEALQTGAGGDGADRRGRPRLGQISKVGTRAPLQTSEALRATKEG